MQRGTYSPPTPEQNIRSFERFPVSRENIVVVYKPYDRLGYGEESKFSLENSVKEFKRTTKLNQENPFMWIPISDKSSPQLTPIPPIPSLNEVLSSTGESIESLGWSIVDSDFSSTINSIVLEEIARVSSFML